MNLKLAFDVKTLSAVLGCKTKSLVYYVYRLPQSVQYKTFEISKKSGGVRVISAPRSNLLLIQKSIARELEDLREFNTCVNGFVKGRDIKRNASFHTGRKFVFNVDLKDFFSSITFPRVYGMLINKPYSLKPKVAACIAKACTLDEVLPQGAPSSPIITNLICGKMDSQLTKLARKYKCRYSRYADDITFSFNRLPPEAIAVPEYDPVTDEIAFVEVGSALAKIIHENGFKVNEEKVRLQGKRCRQEVTGLVVNEKINVKRRFVRQVRAMLHAWEKFGLEAAQNEYAEKYSNDPKEKNFEAVVRGKIGFIRHIKGPSDSSFVTLATKFNKLAEKTPIQLEMTPSEVANSATWITEAPLCQGTAFLLDEVGFVTCAHCVTEGGDLKSDPLNELELWHPDRPSEKFTSQVMKVDMDRDIAVLSIPDDLVDLKPLSISSANPSAEELPIRLLGYPNHSAGNRIRRENGQVVRQNIKSGVCYLEVTTKIIEGNSGGPVLDDEYKVLGIAAVGLGHGADESSAEYLAVAINELTKMPG